MKKWILRSGALLLAAVIASQSAVLTFAQASASGKDETVYVNLGHDGSVDAIYVVNSFEQEAGTTIVDYGDYESVNNLTTTEQLRVENGVITATAPEGKFYYEGKLRENSIPWNIAITYELDGLPIDGADLAGRSGRLKIGLDVSLKEDAPQVYKDNYAVQISVTLDEKKVGNLNAPDATVIGVAGYFQLSYIVLAGNDKAFEITADVVDFEMDGISFNMIPLSIGIDAPDTEEFKEKFRDMQEGFEELDDGVGDLLDGVIQLDDGVVVLRDGLQDMADGVEDLYDGVVDLRDGVKKMRDGVREMEEGSEELRDGMKEFQAGSYEFATGLAGAQSLATALVQAYDELMVSLQGFIPLVGLKTAELAEEFETLSDAVEETVDYIAQLDELITYYETQLDEKQQMLSRSSAASNVGGSLGGGTGGSAEAINPPANETGEKDPEVPQEGEEETETEVPTDSNSPEETGGDEQPGGSEEDHTAGTESSGGEDSSDDSDGMLAYQYMLTPVTDQEVEMLRQTVNTLKGVRTQYSKMMDEYEAQLATIQFAAQNLQSQIQTVYVLINGVENDPDLVGLHPLITQLNNNYGKMHYGLSELTIGVAGVHFGVTELVDGVKEMYDGTYDMKDGVGDLVDGVNEMYDGVTSMRDGTEELVDGVTELKDGTEELVEETADMDEQIDEEIDKMLDEFRGGDFQAVSFVDTSNNDVESVQFIMQTASIKMDEVEEEHVEEAVELTFWQRFLQLFGLYKVED